MIDQLQHEAENSSVLLPPQYAFSFEAERKLVRFAPGGLVPLAVQLGEVKTISEILFAARINSLDSVQRIRVSDDDTTGPQADYLSNQSVTNDPGGPDALFNHVPLVHPGNCRSACRFCLVAARIHHQRHQCSTGGRRRGGVSRSGGAAAAMPGRGGLQTVLNEQLLRVTMVVEVVKLLPKK